MQDVLHNETGMSAEIVPIVRSDGNLLIDGEVYVLTPSQGNPDIQNVSFYAEDPRTLEASYEHHQVYGSSRVTREGTYNSLTGRLEITSTRVNTTSWSVDGSESSSTLVEEFATILTDREPRILVQSAVLPENSHFFRVDTTRIEAGASFERDVKIPVPGDDCVWFPGSDCPYWTIRAGMQARPEDELGLSADILTVEVFDEHLIIEGGVYALTEIDGSGEEQSFLISESEPPSLIGDASDDYVQFYESFVINGEGTFNRRTGVLEFSLTDVNKLTWNLDNSESVSTVEQTYSTVLPVAQEPLLRISDESVNETALPKMQIGEDTFSPLGNPKDVAIRPSWEMTEHRIPVSLDWESENVLSTEVSLPIVDNSRGNFGRIHLYLEGEYTDTSTVCAGESIPASEGSPFDTWQLSLSFDANLSSFGGGIKTSDEIEGIWQLVEPIDHNTCSKNYDLWDWESSLRPGLFHFIGANGYVEDPGGSLVLTTKPWINSGFLRINEEIEFTNLTSGTFNGEIVAEYWRDTKTTRQYALDILGSLRNQLPRRPGSRDEIRRAELLYQTAITVREELYPGSSVNLNIRDVEYMARGIHGGLLMQKLRRSGGDFNNLSVLNELRKLDRNSNANALMPFAEEIYNQLKIDGVSVQANNNPVSAAGQTYEGRVAYLLAQANFSIEEIINMMFNEDGSKAFPVTEELEYMFDQIAPPSITAPAIHLLKIGATIENLFRQPEANDHNSKRLSDPLEGEQDSPQANDGFFDVYVYGISQLPDNSDHAYITVPFSNDLVISVDGDEFDSIILSDQDGFVDSATMRSQDYGPVDLLENIAHGFPQNESISTVSIRNYHPRHESMVIGVKTRNSDSALVLVADANIQTLDEFFSDYTFEDYAIDLTGSRGNFFLSVIGPPTIPVILEESSDLINWTPREYKQPDFGTERLIPIESDADQQWFRLREDDNGPSAAQIHR